MNKPSRTPSEQIGYRAVKAEIVRRVRNNIWAPGTQLPTETDLAAELGCARATVNRAMRELDDEGLLERRRKAGTRVRLAPLRTAQFQIPIIRDEIEASGAQYIYECVEQSCQPGPGWLLSRLKLDDDTRFQHVVCRHLSDRVPYQSEDRWISLDAVPKAADTDFARHSPNEWLVREVPLTDVEIGFSAQAADPATAGLLGTKTGEPVFVSERITWLDGQPVTFARLCFAPGYRMVAHY